MDKKIMYYMFEYDTCAKIEICYPGDLIKGPTVLVENYSSEWYKLPFGKRVGPFSYKDLLKVLENRCFPRTRANCKQLLQEVGLNYYDPLRLVEISHGALVSDLTWIRFEGEEPELWDTINPRHIL